MQARDIMTRGIISVAPQSSVIDAASLLVEHRISALPVIDDGALVGIVSEADLLRRYELGTQRDAASVPWWRRIFGGSNEPWHYVEAHAMKVRDLMSADVVSIAEDTPVADIAALLESHGIKRAPVLDAGRVVGIVSRSDFVRALLERATQGHEAQPQGDESIRAALLAELQSQPWWRPDRCKVTVSGGVVRFVGEYEEPEERAAARVAAENIAGVRGVEDRRSISVPAAGYPARGYL